MNLEKIMLSEINQSHKKTNNVFFHFYEIFRRVKTVKTESKHWLPEAEDWEE